MCSPGACLEVSLRELARDFIGAENSFCVFEDFDNLEAAFGVLNGCVGFPGSSHHFPPFFEYQWKLRVAFLFSLGSSTP
jgi:hypothetical protein